MTLSHHLQSTLRAVLETIIPADDFPGAAAAGVVDYVTRELDAGLAPEAGVIAEGLRELDGEAVAQHALAFAELSARQQAAIFDDLQRGRLTSGWEGGRGFAYLMIRVAMEGFYADPGCGGNREAASWRMIGYEPRMPQTPPQWPALLSATPSDAARKLPDEADVVVIGAGAGGGIVAALLAEAGKRVVVLERGRDLGYGDVGQSHVRNHRLAMYGHNTGPELEGHPRVLVDRHGHEMLLRPHEGGYQNNAMTVGGGTRVYGAQAWRFCPEDFRMASIYGTPQGSSLADWPITYDDLLPDYRRAENEVGVSGDRSGHVRGPSPEEPYPMPPVPENMQRRLLAAGAKKLGWHTSPVPLLVNTVERQGRPACMQCGNCVGFACPSNSKNGTQNTMLPRALATGRCTLLPGVHAERIETDSHGHASGVWFFHETPAGSARHFIRAKVVVSSAGAIESARLLFNSASERHPRGLGNQSDHLGRHLQGHYYAGTIAQFAEEVYDPHGPGVTIATCDFNHGNKGLIGGGMLANEFITLPLIFRLGYQDPDVPASGLANKRWMRESYRKTARVMGPVQEIPSPDGRVTVDPRVRDKHGIPVARLSGTQHWETVRTAEFMHHKAVEWTRASGAVKTWGRPPGLHLSGGQHQAGTCRMSADESRGVTDKHGRVWGTDNVYVADGGLHVTNGGFNPVLTIMALAFRVGAHVAREI